MGRELSLPDFDPARTRAAIEAAMGEHQPWQRLWDWIEWVQARVRSWPWRTIGVVGGASAVYAAWLLGMGWSLLLGE